MTSYVVTGASRGLGYEFLRQLSQDPSNVVVGLVRNKAATEAKARQDGLPKNVHLVEADITSLSAQKTAAQEVTALTGGKLDVLINNAASIPYGASADLSVTGFDSDHDVFVRELHETFDTNVIGVMNTVSAFMPLVLKSSVKKVITLTTGLADAELTNAFALPNLVPYSISKAAVNMVVAKYNAVYKDQGVLFLAISPGLVDTGNMKPPNPDAPPNPMVVGFMKYAPHFRGPITPEESVGLVMKVIESKSVEKGDGGAFVSQFGNKQWL